LDIRAALPHQMVWFHDCCGGRSTGMSFRKPGNVARDGQPAKGKRPSLRTPGTTPSNSA